MDRNFHKAIYSLLRWVLKTVTCRRYWLLSYPLNKHRTSMIWQKQDMYGLAGSSCRRWDLPGVWIPLGTCSLKKTQTSCFHIIWKNLQVKWVVLDLLSQFNIKIKAITEEWVPSDCKISPSASTRPSHPPTPFVFPFGKTVVALIVHYPIILCLYT